jgi:apolipoprotein N-acyltransferase
MKRALPYLAAAASGAAMALSLPLVVPFLSIRQLDPAGWFEPVAWVALVPALLALRAAPSLRAAALRGLVAGLAYFYAAIYWVSNAMTEFGGLSLGLSLVALSLLVLYMAVHWAAAFAVAWTIHARLGWPLHRHLPLVWAAFELSRNYLFSGFPWANLGYTQVRTLPVAQLAALAGVYAVAALVVLVNATLAEAVAARRERRPLPRAALAATAAALALVLVHGELRLGHVRARMAEAPKLTVGVVQPNVNQSVKNRARDNREYILDRLVPLTLEADRRGADLVAWPESSYPIYLSPGVRSLALPGYGLPALSRAHLLMGAATIERRREADGRRVSSVGNVNLLLTPGLEVLGSYQKHHLVPFGEYVPLQEWLPFLKQVVPSFAPAIPGSALSVLEFPAPTDPSTTTTTSTTATSTPTSTPNATATATATPTATPTSTSTPTATSTSTATPTSTPTSTPRDRVRLAPMICFDAIFPEINVAFARAEPEPEVLVNPTNDAWYGYSSGPYQFLAIVRMRAIEAGKAVIRPAYAGVSAVILPTGEVAPGALEVGPVDPDRAPDPDEPAGLLLAEVPRLRGLTLYTRFGDLFAWACAVATAAALAAAAWRRRAGRGAAQ